MKKTILVTGDPICDHNYYKGERRTADSKGTRGFQYAQAGGGALLLKELIDTVMGGARWHTVFGLNDDFRSLPLAYHSFCFWEPQAGNPAEDPMNQALFWRAAEPPLGYGHPTSQLPAGLATKFRTDAYSPNPRRLTGTPDIVVLDDAGIGFRDAVSRKLWSSGRKGSRKQCPRWVVLKLTGSIGRTPLWDTIVRQCKDNLVVIVPAEELRRRHVRISRGLSWEATAEDLTAELRGNPLLTPLLKARHLIVTFQSDAAYWLDNVSGSPSSVLVFDAARAEGEWSESQGTGSTFGFLSCVTAAIVRELCRRRGRPDLEAALGAGLGASRELRRLGHGQVVVGDAEPKPGFPFNEIANKIRRPSSGEFVSSPIPYTGRKNESWKMLDEWQVQARTTAKPRPHFDAAMAVAVLGPEALERFPVARFGSYQTVDREEIESLRTIRQLINNYTKVKRQKTPLNLGVFGPPGSGKSYIVIEIAKEVLNIEEDDVLLFNLSQFSATTELFGAFHRVRDKVLKGETPLVFWDEFDSQKYKWLQYLLAPMEDGNFQDGQITHPIGKCIFVFAGATAATYDQFGPCNPNRLAEGELKQPLPSPDQRLKMETAWQEFVLAKGPDFKSRLVGYLNILGVNPRQSGATKDDQGCGKTREPDLCYPIRRALFIRSLFKVREGECLKLDTNVLRALLEIPEYKSGGRSLQFLCKHLQQGDSGTPSRSNLPGTELLNMHVDAEKFWKLCEQDMGFAPAAWALAQGLHKDWLKGLTQGQRKASANAVPWAKLDDDTRISNVAQAARIPSIVALAGLRVVRGSPVSAAEAAQIGKILEEHAEILAEAEHNGWMVERMLAGWRYARLPKKDPVKKLNPLLIPYAQLHKVEKDKDRRVVRGQKAGRITPKIPNYLERVQRVGFRVEPRNLPNDAAGYSLNRVPSNVRNGGEPTGGGVCHG